MLGAWRIVKRKHRAHAFSGEGARLYGGRWNSPGVALVYTAGSQSLAALEILVHLEASDLLSHYLIFAVAFSEDLVDRIALPLPKGWNAEPVPRKIRVLGDQWCRKAEKPVLAVPSALIPSEHNYLLNPRHAGFGKLEIAKPKDFWIPQRLAGKFK